MIRRAFAEPRSPILSWDRLILAAGILVMAYGSACIIFVASPEQAQVQAQATLVSGLQ